MSSLCLFKQMHGKGEKFPELYCFSQGALSSSNFSLHVIFMAAFPGKQLFSVHKAWATCFFSTLNWLLPSVWLIEKPFCGCAPCKQIKSDSLCAFSEINPTHYL